MKKLLLSIALLITICSSHAQTSSKFGIKAGANNSAISSSQVGATMLSSRTSWYGGFTYSAPINKVFNLQTELLYSREGCQSPDFVFEMDYLRLPILLQYQHEVGLHVEAGFQPGLLLKASQNQNADNTKDDYLKKMPQAGLSMVIGAGYRMKNGLGIEARYAGGLNSAFGANGIKLAVVSGGISYTF